jgi:hypothetical protein
VGIRNLSTHTTERPVDKIALEELAMLSRFARRVDESGLTS